MFLMNASYRILDFSLIILPSSVGYAHHPLLRYQRQRSRALRDQGCVDVLIGHNQAAPRTPLESPCMARTMGVPASAEKV